MGSIFFNAHHAPVGAFASFTLGHKGASGGLGLELGGPARQHIHIGCEGDRKNHFEALPFFESPNSQRERFGLTDEPVVDEGSVSITPFPDSEIHREFTVCSDSWTAGALRFSLYTRVPQLPDPHDRSSAETLRDMLLPCVLAELAIDNRRSATSRRAFFGFTGTDPSCGMRRIRSDRGCGIGQGRHTAIITDAQGAQPGIGFSAEAILEAAASNRLQSGLGDAALLLVDVPPGELKVVRFAVCFFRDGVVTSGRGGSYFYRRFFATVDDVGHYALEHFTDLRLAALTEQQRFDHKRLSPARSFMLAQAVRSYYGSTELLDTDDGPLWIVNEGEYRMINTLDLTVDHLFFEIIMHPWTVKNVLDLYLRRYSFTDRVRAESGEPSPGGIAFTHDMGVANVFAPDGCSAYELPGTTECFSYMTHEELVNWVLTGGVYALRSDDRSWIQQRQTTLVDCLHSLINRDNSDLLLRKGMLRRDTVAVGTGAEITTYDSLDSSLGQARENTAVTVKRWAAFILLQRMFEVAGNHECAETARGEALRSAKTIEHAAREDGTVQAHFDDSSAATLLPVVEGLAYPWFAGIHDLSTGRNDYTSFMGKLKTHFQTVLSSGAHQTSDGGLKLSSSSEITWLSKLYLCRFLATELFGIDAESVLDNADRAYQQWLLDDANSVFAWSDQFRNGKVIGSRYYPRGVTAVLWMFETDPSGNGPAESV